MDNFTMQSSMTLPINALNSSFISSYYSSSLFLHSLVDVGCSMPKERANAEAKRNAFPPLQCFSYPISRFLYCPLLLKLMSHGSIGAGKEKEISPYSKIQKCAPKSTITWTRESVTVIPTQIFPMERIPSL